MGVPDQADPVRLLVHAQLGLERREHVFPDRIARARVVETDLLVGLARLERFQVGTRLRRDRLLRPPGGERCAARELLQREAADDAEIVVSGEADGGVLAGEGHAGVRFGAVADEIAEAPHLLALRGVDLVEHGFEGVTVAVDVRNDRDAHQWSSR